MNAVRPSNWRGTELVWIPPANIVVPHAILDPEQARALRLLLTPTWNLTQVSPVPVADEGRPIYRALSGAHRVGVAKELAAGDPEYLVPCVTVPCPPGDYQSMVHVTDLELVDWLHRLGLHAAAEAARPQLLRAPHRDREGT
jgi:hypothetical protein